MDESEKEIVRLTDEYIQKVSEHCQSVRIFLSYPTDDGTRNFRGRTIGSGNIYAQIGQVREWALEQDQNVKTYADVKQRKELED